MSWVVWQNNVCDTDSGCSAVCNEERLLCSSVSSLKKSDYCKKQHWVCDRELVYMEKAHKE